VFCFESESAVFISSLDWIAFVASADFVAVGLDSAPPDEILQL
jgi:hypothetical protein